MGESPKAEISVFCSELELFSAETPGGRIRIRWDHEGSATPNAQLAFLAEFLATAGVYESWVESCPLTYSSGNAPHKRDVLGTWFLSILAGHHRYAHITGLRGDGDSPQLLGMNKIVSEDALRRERLPSGRCGFIPASGNIKGGLRRSVKARKQFDRRRRASRIRNSGERRLARWAGSVLDMCWSLPRFAQRKPARRRFWRPIGGAGRSN